MLSDEAPSFSEPQNYESKKKKENIWNHSIFYACCDN